MITTAGANISVVRSSRLDTDGWIAGAENTGTANRFVVVTAICATVDP